MGHSEAACLRRLLVLTATLNDRGRVQAERWRKQRLRHRPSMSLVWNQGGHGGLEGRGSFIDLCTKRAILNTPEFSHTALCAVLVRRLGGIRALSLFVPLTTKRFEVGTCWFLIRASSRDLVALVYGRPVLDTRPLTFDNLP